MTDGRLDLYRPRPMSRYVYLFMCILVIHGYYNLIPLVIYIIAHAVMGMNA